MWHKLSATLGTHMQLAVAQSGLECTDQSGNACSEAVAHTASNCQGSKAILDPMRSFVHDVPNALPECYQQLIHSLHVLAPWAETPQSSADYFFGYWRYV